MHTESEPIPVRKGQVTDSCGQLLRLLWKKYMHFASNEIKHRKKYFWSLFFASHIHRCTLFLTSMLPHGTKVWFNKLKSWVNVRKRKSWPVTDTQATNQALCHPSSEYFSILEICSTRVSQGRAAFLFLNRP